MFYLELVQNVGLLVSLVVIHGQIIRRWNNYTHTPQIFSGFLFGCVALVGMMTPVHLMPGLIFDGRSIVLSVAGLFGGPVTAGMAALISAAYRIWFGGPGMIMGVSVILESAGLGVGFYYLRRRHPGLTRNLYLFAFGMLVHVGMLSLTLTLPREAMLETLEHIAVPVLLIYPAATWLICLLFLDQESRVSAEQALRESEDKFRKAFFSSPDAIAISRLIDGMYVSINEGFKRVIGYDREEVIGKTSLELNVWANLEDRNKLIEILKTRDKVDNFEVLFRTKTGEMRYGLLSASIILLNGVEHVLNIVRDITERKLADKLLHTTVQRYHAILSSMYTGVLVASEEGRVDFINQAFCDLFDIQDPPTKLQGLTPTEIIQIIQNSFPEPDKAINRIQALVAQGLPVKGEDITLNNGRILTRDSIPIFIDGKRYGRLWLHHDVTENKKAQEILLEQEIRYRTVADFTHDWEYWVNAEGNFLYVSPSCERITGYTAQEFVDDPDLMNRIIHPDDCAAMMDHYHSVRTIAVHTVDAKDFRIVRRDGATRWIGHVCQPVYDQAGRPSGRRVSNRDITNRKRHELAQKRLFTAIEQASDAIFITDAQGNIEYVNPAFERITGYSKEEVRGEKPSLFRSEEYDSSTIQSIQETLVRGESWGGRLVKRRKDGAPYEEDVTITPVRDALGNIINFVGVKRDVSREVQLQRQLLQAQKMEAIGNLAGGIAHDFNNLLQAVMGYSELLLRGKKQGDPELDHLQRIYDSGKRGADLVKSLLMFSRKVQPEFRPVDMNHEIVQVQKLLSHSIPKTIKIDLRLSGALETVRADPSQIGQVIMNLGVNSRDAMPDGGTLTIETANVELDKDYCAVHLEVEPGPYASLTVSDSGHGMDKQTLTHIFEPFFTSKEVGKGTGLGLATVYGIVKQHGGHITCYSEPGIGTTFKIYFPAIEKDRNPETPTTEKPIPGGTETILLVEDDDAIRELGVGLLNEFGYKVITAGNGIEALEIYQLEVGSISLVILDLIMPEMDGRKCLEKILRVNPKAKVIIASGYSESGSGSGAMAGGEKGFVQKPYNMRQLLTTIRDLLDAD
ncbi:MAG: two-component system, cell cycle sensor histidine kinase and response regulator CckA [Thermodesulfobacteriota bacterium]|nr:two-component system, cell cycle sensor histidine kinase and response regulator CckA [Thermodesulfobacteriota bacterium]